MLDRKRNAGALLGASRQEESFEGDSGLRGHGRSPALGDLMATDRLPP
jgi:hypothetical protein